MGKQTKIRVNCGGYQGKPVSVFAAYDPEYDVLVIARESEYETSPRDGFLRVTTRDADPAHDMVFTEDEVREAIGAFFEMEAMGLVKFAEGMSRLDPKHRIERDGMDERGAKFRFSPDIANGQVAVLIAVYAARRQNSVAKITEFMDELSGALITI